MFLSAGTKATPISDGYQECRQASSKVLEEFLCDNSGPSVDRQLHLADLLVDLLHEIDDKVHQLVFIHLFCVEVGDEEADVIALNRFPPQDEEVLCSHHHEPHKFMAEDLLNLIGLFDSNADSHGVYRPLDQDLLLVIAAYDHRLQQKLFAAPNLHLRLVVSLHHLRGEVLQTQGCLKSGAHCIQVGSQCCRHFI